MRINALPRTRSLCEGSKMPVNHTNILYLLWGLTPQGEEKILLCPLCFGHLLTNHKIADRQIKETIKFKTGMKLQCSRCNRWIGELTTYDK